ncbi:archaeosortase/exosortase family protein [Acidisphaera sp. S103]|uniref:archaeosortase/exosortase family protein n=1 Tax=Acidisphaera sp. S103 TaxID=1747223 RepID=UPI00131B2BD0|nr:archaeosortase/exosortase family protein [Acidisphaera sp. S103]
MLQRTQKIILIAVVAFVVCGMMLATPRLEVSDADAVGAQSGLQVFELLGLLAAIYCLAKARSMPATAFQSASLAGAVLLSLLNFHGAAVIIAATSLLCGNLGDANIKAAGTIVAAIAVQAVVAPFVFTKVAPFLLPLDAAAAGFLLSMILPGASWSGTVIHSINGHSVVVLAGCSSFHNLSLAMLCWVTITMAYRPYWTRHDLWVGARAGFIQITFNVARLLLVSISYPMFHFWHDGVGRHYFAAAATFTATLVVAMGVLRADRKAPARSPEAPISPAPFFGG